MTEKAKVHIFIGEDTKRSGDAFRRAVDEARRQYPNALVSQFDDLTFEPVLLREALRNQSIFGGENIVVIDGMSEHEGGEEFYQELGEMSGVANMLFIRESVPSKEIRAVLKQIGTIEEFPLKKIIEKKNTFAIADAVAMRDKRSAWVELVKLQRSGAAMEEVHGMIFWAIKTLAICATETKEEAQKSGMKEFTYRTYYPRTKKFLDGELEQKLGELKDMYHRAHQGEGDLGLFLEQFLLKI